MCVGYMQIPYHWRSLSIRGLWYPRGVLLPVSCRHPGTTALPTTIQKGRPLSTLPMLCDEPSRICGVQPRQPIFHCSDYHSWSSLFLFLHLGWRIPVNSALQWDQLSQIQGKTETSHLHSDSSRILQCCCHQWNWCFGPRGPSWIPQEPGRKCSDALGTLLSWKGFRYQAGEQYLHD